MSTGQHPYQKVTVLLDFDGTITVEDTCVHLLRRLAPPGWQAPGKQYRARAIDGRTCLLREWAMLPHDLDLLLSVAGEVGLDPGLWPILDHLRGGGAEVVVVSDGFGFTAEYVMGGHVEVVTNRVRDGILTFPHADTGCACGGCGVCKPAAVRAVQARGRTAVLVGDGTSDRLAARVADIVFAKEDLAVWCLDEGIAHIRVESLADVIAALPAALGRYAGRALPAAGTAQ